MACIDGDIIRFNDSHVVLSSNFPHIKKQLSSAGRCVGRIFAEFVDSKGEVEINCGTGFFVSENVIATAQHVIDNYKDFKLRAIYFTLKVDATYGENVLLNEEDTEVYSVQQMLPKLVDGLEDFDRRLPMTSVVSSGKYWEIKNDFCFLQVQGYISSTFALPAHMVVSTDPTAHQAFVIGYPGSIDQKEFEAD
eukprot:TRINITY_DN20277_c0_g1_i1.p1 TRINITY_DN20277_c0_g1~~TRINITY_DN20277_c0_g1_i1.p1  ORF type:complete len:193 (-),score=25.72 TRINITY_DN20277_c0_g1_i1:451-1029(-)